ncbi:E3 ubiquitin-protein ligase hrd1 [Arachnomyces sp. PD_36]|nr:E3 ubiquitin-protein ligase hrd1 [Arachnomyces sp. PD_36]
MRLAVYSGVSLALATGVVLKALHQRANFYAACVYLSQSSANLMILTNFILLIVGYFIFGLQRLLYGPLRQIETEQLYEKAWFAVTETCLAMTIFRGEVGGWFLVMFVCLLVGKVWGWIGEGRVEILQQQPPANPRLFHTRLAISLILSVSFNAYMLEYSIQTVLRQARPDMMVMFGFEFAILTILSTSTAARYAISLVEIYITQKQKQAKMEERRLEIRAARAETLRNRLQSESNEPAPDLPDENSIDEAELDVPGWEEKGRWVFYLDLVTDFFKLIVYMSFFAILFTFYGLPIHILRDVVLTVRSFVRRIADFIRYRNATRDMNERYPDATAEEVANEEVCIICREEMRPWGQAGGEGEAAAPGGAAAARPAGPGSDRLRPKKLPCGHILHFACLRSWLERQQNCPTCRRPVVPTTRGRIQPGQANGIGRGNAGVGGQQANAGQHADGAGDQDGQGRGVARVFHLGPLRVGFGAGRGDLFRNFAQQVGGDAQAGQANQNDPEQAGRHQIGFGFGFGRAAPAQAPPANQAHYGQNNTTNLHQQLSQIEVQITQEINNLRVTADQLHTVRLLQAELARLRSMSIPGVSNQATAATSGASQPVTASAVQRQFTVNPQAQSMGAGDSQLPEGVVLPEGWTLVPLQRAEQYPINPGQPGPSSAPPYPSTMVPPPPPFVSSQASHLSNSTVVTVPGGRGGGESSASNQHNADTTSTSNAFSSEVPRATATTDDGPRTGTPPLGSSWTEVSSEGLFNKQEGQRAMANGGEAAESSQSNGYVDGDKGEDRQDEKGKARAVTVEEVDDENS